MRTASVCPTCSTYENALCVIYDGPTLTTLNIQSQDDLQTILSKIETYALAGVPGSSIVTRDEGVLIDTSCGVLNFVGAGVSASDAGSNVTTITVPGESNDLSTAVTWVNVPDAYITLSSVQQHQSNLTITESQISDLSHYSTWLSLTDTDPASFIGAAGHLVRVNSTPNGLEFVDGSTLFAASSHTHTASEITDFDTEVSNNASVVANTAKVTFPGFTSLAADYGYSEPTHTWIELTDTDPASYAGSANYLVRVNSTPDGLEFVDPSTVIPAVEDTAYGVGWSGNASAASKNAIYNKFESLSFGDVTKVGTPANNQLGVWTGDGTIEGSSQLLLNGSTMTLGTNDTTAGSFGIYGNNLGTGGILYLYNGATGDTTTQYYAMQAVSGRFEITHDAVSFFTYISSTDGLEISPSTVQLTAYGGGTITGTATYMLAVDSSGNIVEEALPAAGGGGSLEEVTEVSTGWRLKEESAANHGNIGDKAVDVSHSSIAGVFGATGAHSFAANERATASGMWSVALGYKATASGLGALCGGYSATGATAGGNNSFVWGGDNTDNSRASCAVFGNSNQVTGTGQTTFIAGNNNEADDTAAAFNENNFATGYTSFAGGMQNYARSFAETALGCWGTDYTPDSTSAHDVDDRILNIGIGTASGSKADGLTLYKSGSLTLQTYGSQTHTGTATYSLAVDTNGNVIEEELGKTVTADTTTTYNFVIGDANNIVTLNNAGAVSAVIPANASVAYAVGTQIDIINLGAGTVTVSITTDTLNQNVGGLTLAQYDKRTITKVATTAWVLSY